VTALRFSNLKRGLVQHERYADHEKTRPSLFEYKIDIVGRRQLFVGRRQPLFLVFRPHWWISAFVLGFSSIVDVGLFCPSTDCSTGSDQGGVAFDDSGTDIMRARDSILGGCDIYTSEMLDVVNTSVEDSGTAGAIPISTVPAAGTPSTRRTHGTVD
jgi:hypothetical protein